ncbi:LysM peptidoglycan-binding domain-containing protein [Alicyclobacillus fastidiosus]|uniref:LysM peptidoglycan-binding domain-containing protein n=1 Tax=Alicyclobacillus fastidiosus TaxID=392011 RepID=A0ABV5AIH7_9BACL|nr:LysM peptidoglycan-binding domain-containing protein [Alicyclobacillus fastidiosus]WEH11194.1 LysM peptidoglycan-binding domain-containing protein [Alicyclobacillus fastidiosus]
MKKYVIQPGDTLYQISQRTGVRVPLLLASNPQIQNPGQLMVGTTIVIPELGKPAKSKAGKSTSSQREKVPPYFGFVWPHQVAEGDTWDAIAKKYGVKLEQLHHVNPEAAEVGQLTVGHVVYVPTAALKLPNRSEAKGAPHGAMQYPGTPMMPFEGPGVYAYPYPTGQPAPGGMPYVPGQPMDTGMPYVPGADGTGPQYPGGLMSGGFPMSGMGQQGGTPYPTYPQGGVAPYPSYPSYPADASTYPGAAQQTGQMGQPMAQGMPETTTEYPADGLYGPHTHNPYRPYAGPGTAYAGQVADEAEWFVDESSSSLSSCGMSDDGAMLRAADPDAQSEAAGRQVDAGNGGHDMRGAETTDTSTTSDDDDGWSGTLTVRLDGDV